MRIDSSTTVGLEMDWPILVSLVLIFALISIGLQILENDRQRRKLVVAAGDNQETRQRGRLFLYTALILGLLTLVVNYIMGITASLAAAHIDEVTGPVSLFGLPGLWFTVLTLLVYTVAILGIAALFLKNERIEMPEFLADLHDAGKFGALDRQVQIDHYSAQLDALIRTRNAARDRQSTSGEFAELFTAHESVTRPRFKDQRRYLWSAPERMARVRHFHRRILLNYRVAAGKWLLPLAVIAVVCVWVTFSKAVSMNDGGTGQDLLLAWGAASVLALLALVAQYRCELGKVLLKSRKEFISDQTEIECRRILSEAAADVAEARAARAAAAKQAAPAAVVHGNANTRPAAKGETGVLLRIGSLEIRRRAR